MKHLMEKMQYLSLDLIKDKSKAQQSLLKSPLAPMYNTVMRAFYIENQIPFFKQ